MCRDPEWKAMRNLEKSWEVKWVVERLMGWFCLTPQVIEKQKH